MNIKKTSKFKAYTCQIGMLAGEIRGFTRQIVVFTRGFGFFR
ncbi:hypothetical protein ACQKGI_15360 [Peribacillus muralis]